MRKIGLKDFYNYKCISSLTLSPEGDKLAYIVSSVNEEDNDYDSNLFMMRRDAAGKNWQEVQLVADGKAGEFFFEDNDTILFQAKRGKDRKKGEEEPITVYQRLPLGGGEARKAYEFPIPVSDLRKQPDGNYLLTGQTYVKYPDYFAMTEAGRKKVLKEIKENKDYEELTESPFWRNGEGITQGTRNTLFHYDVETGKLRRLTDTLLTVDCFEVIGGYVYVIGRTFENREEYKSGLYRIDVAAGSCTEMVRPYLQIMEMGKIDDKLIVLGSECRRYGENENPFFYVYDTAREEKDFTLLREADEGVFDGVISDIEYGSWRGLKSDGNHVYYMALDGTRNVLLRIGLDGNTETVVNKEGALYDFDVLSGDLWVMGLYDMKLQEIYHADQKGSLRRMTRLNEAALRGKYVAKPEYICTKYHSDRYGDEEIDGWVLAPRDYEVGKKYPAILDIHGGPKCAYGPIFFHEMQHWASEGYFVMFCNPHGSDGKGNEFAYLDMQWGGIDYEQIMAFVGHVLEAYPDIDRAKMCCTGGSYGGFMSNWINGHTDRFCCIATQRSIMNWITMYGISDIPPLMCGETCNTDPYSQEGFAQMWDVSPLRYIGNARTPTLIIHSDEDYRCPIGEGYQLFTALKYKGIPAKMVVFHGENHELSRSGKPKHKLKRLKEITEWFRIHTADTAPIKTVLY